MNDLLHPSAVRTTLPLSLQSIPLQQSHSNWAPLPTPSTHGADGRGAARPLLQEEAHNPNQRLVARWLAGTTEVSPRGLQTPPLEMNGGGPGPRLPATYGGLYNNHTTVPTSLPPTTGYESSLGFYDRKDFSLVAKQPQGSFSQPHSPTQQKDNAASDNSSRRRNSGDGNQIVSYLQIPASINNSKGSLAEFAAQITCLFWFESSFTLHRVEESRITPTPSTPLVPEALPNMGFRKWVTTILSTTQVTQNVILLALMFIYRLKKLNPTVKGRPGSEYRLLTVALMLGNKFLDDNTYTNKTWAEVSGISVGEIHIMEVEFLSNMRYTLYASEKEWNLWHRKLGRFWDYFDKASRPPVESNISTAPTPQMITPYPFPSPPQSHHSSPPFSSAPDSNGILRPYQPMPLHMVPPIPSPMARMPEVDLRPSGIKRSHDESMQEPAAKRLAQTKPFRAPVTVPSISSSLVTPAVPRLPIPNLSISTSGHLGLHPGTYSAQLPPPSSGRSMSTVQSGSLQTPHPNTTLLNPLTHSSASSSSILPPMNDHFRRPYNEYSRTSSPTSTTFPPPNQDLLSPSGYPPQRSSPYKPIRKVNTLLVPPPSASLHNPSQNLGFQNMHYQPLGKPLSERKTGVVPYLPLDSWQNLPQMPQWSGSHPTLPPPNFRP